VEVKPVYALLDSGSTHSFVDPSVLLGYSCQISQTNPLIVMVANGDKMVTNSKCSALQFSLQGQSFIGDLRLLPIQGYDLILGLDWLSQFIPMVVDWSKKWVQFERNGEIVKLQVQKEVAEISLCEAVNVSKELQEGSELLIAHI
jgi:Retroviral aspartyl protease